MLELLTLVLLLVFVEGGGLLLFELFVKFKVSILSVPRVELIQRKQFIEDILMFDAFCMISIMLISEKFIFVWNLLV